MKIIVVLLTIIFVPNIQATEKCTSTSIGSGFEVTCSNITSLYNLPKISYQEYCTVFRIKDSTISILPSSVFINFTMTNVIYLNHLHIALISPGAFNGLSRLRYLNLDNNDLTELSDGIFSSVSHILRLNVSNNKIHQIGKGVLKDLNNLRTVDLTNNNLSTVESGLFETNKQLTHLYLSGNPLTAFHVNGLSKLVTFAIANTSLLRFNHDLSNLTTEYLYLSSNHLSTIDFSVLPKTDYLYIDNNKFNTTNLGVTNVKGVYMGHNQLQVLRSPLFNGSLDFEELDFKFNSISTIEENTFFGFFNLSALHLDNNNIKKINPGLFRDLTSLTFLNLSHNIIEEFEDRTFDSLTNLEGLDVSHNKLVDLHQTTFHSLKELRYLFFENNQISFLQITELLKNSPKLDYLSLNDNLWNCNDLVGIAEAFRGRILVTGGHYYVDNVHGIRCSNNTKN